MQGEGYEHLHHLLYILGEKYKYMRRKMDPWHSTTEEDKHDQSTKLNKKLGNHKNRLWGLMAKSLESGSWDFFFPTKLFFQMVKKTPRTWVEEFCPKDVNLEPILSPWLKLFWSCCPAFDVITRGQYFLSRLFR